MVQLPNKPSQLKQSSFNEKNFFKKAIILQLKIKQNKTPQHIKQQLFLWLNTSVIGAGISGMASVGPTWYQLGSLNGTRGSIAWLQVGAGCGLVTQPSLWAKGLHSSLLELLQTRLLVS